MRKAHTKVIEAFMRGMPAHNTIPATFMNGEHATVSRLHTDGKVLYSYRMAIAKRIRHGAGGDTCRSPRAVSFVIAAEGPTATTRSQLASLRVALYKEKYDVKERETVGPDFEGVGFAMPPEGARVEELPTRRRRPKSGPCPRCGERMEYGDELPEERCCDKCAAKTCPECGEPTEDGLCRNSVCSCGQTDLESTGMVDR